MKPSRPTGITILAILDFIGGALAAIGGSGLLDTLGYGTLFSGLLSGFVVFFGAILLIVSLFSIVSWGTAYGRASPGLGLSP